ncbi:ribonuclease E [Microbacterium sp. ru370.1]|uniref:Rne/Rng family ribonuclease n=1 Tax=unclassified Microbacterium TaxID=2609290 RepID=UPI0008847F8F|nr:MULTISPECIES: Rne/Rng family ribonuclease [unclassified Microbacterium]SDO78886.1 ribonuclease E [Microbacterium sp. ru370.1]SIT89305.1 ribonuclease E [Microbacterium sp. RU1D]
MAEVTDDQTPAEQAPIETPETETPETETVPAGDTASNEASGVDEEEAAVQDAASAAADDTQAPAVLEADASASEAPADAPAEEFDATGETAPGAPEADDADVPAADANDAEAPEADAPAADASDAARANDPAGPAAEANDAGQSANTADAAAKRRIAAEPETPAEPEKPARPTAVSLGLLPENFVSAVSTALHFYAPALPPLPARDEAWESDDRDDDGPAERGSANARRRNRRRGGASTGSADELPETPAAPVRQRAVEVITEPQRIKGSTRLEAKKQRRRDGREAGRRRPVVTEAEFLARREAVDRVMVVRSKAGRIQIAVLEDNVLVEHYVARNQDASLIGNVYLGRVQNVLPSMEAAFVDIGRGRNAVLYSGEVDWDGVETNNQPRRIELALKSGDRVLVQVTKDPVGHKGARLTSQISLPGRYLVYVPNGTMNGISRKLPDTERARLKKILKEVLPESSGVIVRTAAEGATEEQLTLDVQRLTSQWEHVSSQVKTIQAPALLHSEPDLLVKIVRDVFNEDFTRMLIQGDEALQTISSYLKGVAPDLLERVEKYEGEQDPFDAFRVTEQIEKALDRKVWLPSGGSLVIDRTEAMTVVDVNTGKFVGSGGNLEETVTKNNLEAAEEIVRQLRLRDIGGIIVVDFIDMVLESNRDLVLRRLIECLSRDRTKHQVAEVTSLGLVQMTRKKLGLGLLETFSEACEVCAGRGVIVHHDPVVRHRSSSPAGGSGSGNGNGNGGSSNRRGRGGNGQGGNGQNNGSGNGASQNGGNGANGAGAAAQAGGTHVITEGVKSALAQIAASTVKPTIDDPAVVEAAVVASVEAVLEAKSEPEAPAAPVREKRPRKKREPKAPRTEKDALLESVLEALPEPKAPGQGRSRRRVTTAALTGTPVNAQPTTPES